MFKKIIKIIINFSSKATEVLFMYNYFKCGKNIKYPQEGVYCLGRKVTR